MFDINYSTESRHSYRASVKDGNLLEDRVGSLIVTHIHNQTRPLMEQEQPLDLSLTEADHNRVSFVKTVNSVLSFTTLQVKSPLDVQKMLPCLKQTNTGAVVLWNFLWAILENNHTHLAE